MKLIIAGTSKKTGETVDVDICVYLLKVIKSEMKRKSGMIFQVGVVDRTASESRDKMLDRKIKELLHWVVERGLSNEKIENRWRMLSGNLRVKRTEVQKKG